MGILTPPVTIPLSEPYAIRNFLYVGPSGHDPLSLDLFSAPSWSGTWTWKGHKGFTSGSSPIHDWNVVNQAPGDWRWYADGWCSNETPSTTRSEGPFSTPGATPICCPPPGGC